MIARLLARWRRRRERSPDDAFEYCPLASLRLRGLL